tara:strand:- start:1396 stop:1956 length:561 start_codon:yes stop_codon:yes gene_type:complete
MKFWYLYLLLGTIYCNAYNQPKIIRELARENFRLVPYFANPIKKKHSLNRDQYNDLIQEGYIGLMYAARKYDHNNVYNTKFSTYSSYWIKSYMTKYIKGIYNTALLPLNEDIYVYKEKELWDIKNYNLLNQMEMDVLYKRYVQKPRYTSKQLAYEYDISREMILKISDLALKKLRNVKEEDKEKYF